jgi:hypothetical protein
MKDITIGDLSDTNVGFVANRAHVADAVWVRGGFYSEDVADTHRRFSEQFSYLIRDSECFSSLRFDSDQRLMIAERYGGEGIGTNGGGVRCGNWGAFQIKGIGCNPLVGTRDNVWHSYGGLNAQDAIYEAIYAEALSRILPCGVVTVFGVILTANDAAYSEVGERGWGALLVREICLRPGHFLRSRAYRPTPGTKAHIARDTARVRDVNRGLHSRFAAVRDVVRWLGQFLQNCANQLAFARVARIAHGAITPSNLCFDGRWIDLTNVSFIDGGTNVGGRPAFYEEPAAVVNCLVEFAETFGKYNEIELTVRPLVDYYFQQLEGYNKYYLSTLFGISPKLVSGCTSKAEYLLLVQQASLVLHSGNCVVDCWPEAIVANDPVIALQSALFVSLSNPTRAFEQLSRLRGIDSRFRPQEMVTAFKEVVASAFQNAKNDFGNMVGFVHLCAIEALKRSLFVEYFYKRRLIGGIRRVLDTDPYAARALIEDSIEITEWLFAPPEAGTTSLFRGNGLSLSFRAQNGTFVFESSRTGTTSTHRDVQSLIEAVQSCANADFITHGYNFKTNLLVLLHTLLPIAQCK